MIVSICERVLVFDSVLVDGAEVHKALLQFGAAPCEFADRTHSGWWFGWGSALGWGWGLHCLDLGGRGLDVRGRRVGQNAGVVVADGDADQDGQRE